MSVVARTSDRQLWLLIPGPLRALLLPVILLCAIAADLALISWALVSRFGIRPSVSLAAAGLGVYLVLSRLGGFWYESAGMATLDESETIPHTLCIELAPSFVSSSCALCRATGMVIASTTMLVHLTARHALAFILEYPALATCLVAMSCLVCEIS